MTSLIRPPDERANLATHGAGFLLSVVGACRLMQCAAPKSFGVILACAVYSVALLLVYGNSTLSHFFCDAARRRQFRTADQACIFLLIAATYTPIAAIYLNRDGWTGVLIGTWLAAGIGIGRVMLVRDLSRSDKLLYGILTCVPLTSLPELSRHTPASVMTWIASGGACYCLGLPFLRWSAAFRYSHAVWHLSVVAGSICHYYAILLAVSAA